MKPELLAPAGNIESLAAAIEGGADAIYLGLNRFNARLRADNFTHQDIEALIPEIVSMGKRIYVTLNTLIKDSELPQMIETLAHIEQLGTHGVIVQDPGLALLIREYFPRIALHASTQMAIHNSMGLKFLESQGFTRAILARELTIEEIRSIVPAASVELEVFIHGALCYSISGMCLFSSYLGGKSGNRGRCTQPCRRLYRRGGFTGYPFSTRDLCALSLVPALADAGVKAFKIEGRMKGPQYILPVVRAYRTVIDQGNEGVAEALAILAEAPGRATTTFFLEGFREKILEPGKPGDTGISAGQVIACEHGMIRVRTAIALAKGDMLRVPDENAPMSLKVNRMMVDGIETASVEAGREVTLFTGVTVPAGSTLVKAGEKFTSPLLLHLKKSPPAPGVPARRKRAGERMTEILKALRPFLRERRKRPGTPPVIAVLLPSVPKSLAAYEGMRIHLPLMRETLRALETMKDMSYVAALPPFIAEEDMPFFSDAVQKLLKRGVCAFELNNLSHRRLFADGQLNDTILIGGTHLHALNTAAMEFYRRQGLAEITISWEADRAAIIGLIVSNVKIRKGVAVYGRPPLFTSRIPLATGEWQAGDGEHYFTQRRDNLYCTYPEKAFSLTSQRELLTRAGVDTFIIDLRGDENLTNLPSIIQSLRKGRVHGRTKPFNFLGKLL